MYGNFYLKLSKEILHPKWLLCQWALMVLQHPSLDMFFLVQMAVDRAHRLVDQLLGDWARERLTKSFTSFEQWLMLLFAALFLCFGLN